MPSAICRASETGNDDAGLSEIWKTSDPIHHKLCGRPHEHTRFPPEPNMTSEGIDRHIEHTPHETDGCHDSIKFLPPAFWCIVQTIDVSKNENHCFLWEEDSSTAALVSCPGHLPQERHLECLPVADSNQLLTII